MSDLSTYNPLLITNPTNIHYLTGFVGAAPEEREAYCLLAQNKLFLFTNALYIEQTKNLKPQIPILKQSSIEVIEISRENPISKELAKVTSTLGIKQLAFEDTSLTVAELTKLKTVLTSVELVPSRGTIEAMRQHKRDDEIQNIRDACTLTDECFTYILSLLRPGVTEAEIAWEIRTYFARRNASDAFSPIVAFGAHSSMPHYMPTQTGSSFGLPQDKQGSVLERNDVAKSSFGLPQDKQGSVLKDNDVALFDFGARVNGYCADMTRVVFIGKPKDEWITGYKTVMAAQQAAIDVLYKHFDLSINRSGGVEISGAALDQAARDVIIKAGLPVYPHSLGHAVGLDIHEAPRLSVSNNDVLRPGMVFSIEPGVYIKGNYGIRIEDLVLLRGDGIEVLSTSHKDVTIL